MKDGNTIEVNRNKRFYASENEFVHELSFSFHRQYNFTNVEQIYYSNDQEYTVFDFNKFYVGFWEIAEYGCRLFLVINHITSTLSVGYR